MVLESDHTPLIQHWFPKQWYHCDITAPYQVLVGDFPFYFPLFDLFIQSAENNLEIINFEISAPN